MPCLHDRRVLGASALVLAGSIGAVAAVHLTVAGRVDRALAAARRSPPELTFEPIPPRARDERHGDRLWTSLALPTDGAGAGGRLLVATGGGLVEVVAGRTRRVRTASSDPGLADHDITAAAAQGERIVLGTRGGSLAVLDGDHARSYRLGSGRLGAIVDLGFDGEELYAATTSGRVVRVTDGLTRAVALEPIVEGGATAVVADPEGVVLVGADGVVRRVEADRLVAFGRPRDGAPRLRLTAAARLGDRWLVGSPTGLFEVDGSGRLVPAREGFFVTSLLVTEGRVLVATHDRGVLILDGERLASPPLARALPGRRVDRLREVGGRPMAFGPGLVATIDVASGAADPVPLPDGLASNHITALAIDAQERVWVGTFDDGVDVLGATGEVVRHLPPPSLSSYSSVNALAFEESTGSMLVGTSHGALVVCGDAVETLDRTDGLVGEAVTALLVHRGERVFATNRGLSVSASEGGGVRSIYAFHGLPSSRLYALAADDERLWVGTLGGVAVVEGLRVVRSLRASTGQLRAPWCTALAVAPEGTYAGTNAGGLDLLREDGSVERLPLPDGVARISVNPGALLIDGDRLLVGTLEQGLLIFQRDRTEWLTLDQPLPGASVTALAVAGEALWVGTDRGLLRLERENVGGRRP